MSQLLMESNWNTLKSGLLEGLSGSRQNVMNVVLENQRKQFLNESASAGATSAGNIATVNKVILPLIRRVLPTLIANELVGVQAISGPVAQIHTLRYKYADEAPDVTVGQEMFTPYQLAKAYTGDLTADNENPSAAPTSMLEGVMGRRLTTQILRETVEAKTRRVSARWTIEAAQDAQSQHNIDIETENLNAMANELTFETDQEIIGRLYNVAGAATTVYDQTKVSGVATYVGDEHAALAILINRQANDIARKIRHGIANWAVVNTDALTVLQSAGTSSFARTTEGTFDAPTNVKYSGTLNNSMKVYVNTYFAGNTDLLIGYKGSNETNAGVFYCPYIPLISSGTQYDPQTGELVASFMTRYGIAELTDSTSTLGNASDYYARIGFKNVTFM